ncbi:hypothetical protein AMTR_s05095p00005390, partial [Amborella trichopoda]
MFPCKFWAPNNHGIGLATETPPSLARLGCTIWALDFMFDAVDPNDTRNVTMTNIQIQAERQINEYQSKRHKHLCTMAIQK